MSYANTPQPPGLYKKEKKWHYLSLGNYTMTGPIFGILFTSLRRLETSRAPILTWLNTESRGANPKK